MLIAEDLKVDGEEVSRLNRFEASYYTTLWFLRKLQETDDKMYSAFAPCVGDVLRALIAYSPKNKEDDSLKHIKNIDWQGANEQQTAKGLLEWIVERITPYIPYQIEESFPDALHEARPSIERMLERVVRQMTIGNLKDLEKPSINPFIAIQDFFNLDAFKVFSKSPRSDRLAIVRVLGAIKRFIEGARRFLSISKKFEEAGRINQLRSVTDDLFYVYAFLKLKLDKPYEIQFKQLQYFEEAPWSAKGARLELNLDEARSNHIELRVKEGALSFTDGSTNKVTLLVPTTTSEPPLEVEVDIEKVFGRVHVETERCRHFYTTKDSVAFEKENGSIGKASRVEIPIRVRVSFRTRMVMTLILIGAVALSLAMCVFADLNVLVGGLGIYTVFLGIALFPKEHYLTLKLLKPHLWVLLSIAFVGILGGVVFFVLSKLNVLLPLMELMIKWLDP